MSRYPFTTLILSMIFIATTMCFVRDEPISTTIINFWFGFFMGGLYGWYLK